MSQNTKKQSKGETIDIQKSQELFLGNKDKLQVLSNPYANITVRVNIKNKRSQHSSDHSSQLNMSVQLVDKLSCGAYFGKASNRKLSHRSHSETKISCVIERHIQSQGTESIGKNSNLIVTQPQSQVVQFKDYKKKESKAIFDINRSIITLCAQREPRPKAKIFGREIEIVDSEDEDNQLAKRVINESFQPLVPKKHVEVEIQRYNKPITKGNEITKQMVERVTQKRKAGVHQRLPSMNEDYQNKPMVIQETQATPPHFGRVKFQIRIPRHQNSVQASQRGPPNRSLSLLSTDRKQESTQRKVVTLATNEPTFSINEIQRLFLAKTKDIIGTNQETNFLRFQDYCAQQCVSRKVNFKNLFIKTNTVMELALVLKVNTNIAHLNIASNGLKDDNIGILCQAIQWNHTIVHLDLQENSLTGRGCSKVFQSLMGNDSICSLNIGNFSNSFKNRMGDEGIEKLAPLLKTSKILSLLDLRNMTLNDANIIGLSEGLRFNTSLSYLNLSKNEITHSSLRDLMEALKISPTLVDLDLSQNPLTCLGAIQIALFLKDEQCRLVKLQLSKCLIKIYGGYEIFQSLTHKKFNGNNCSLAKLVMNQNNLESKQPQPIFHKKLENAVAKSYLVELNLISCNLQSWQCTAIACGLISSKLKTLDISHNHCEDIGCQSFGAILKTDQCHLSDLNLQCNEITDAGGELLGEALQSNRHLLSLNMTGNEIGETTGKVILESMRTNKNLRHLHLEKNFIKPLLLSLILDRVSNNSYHRNTDQVSYLQLEKKTFKQSIKTARVFNRQETQSMSLEMLESQQMLHECERQQILLKNSAFNDVDDERREQEEIDKLEGLVEDRYDAVQKRLLQFKAKLNLKKIRWDEKIDQQLKYQHDITEETRFFKDKINTCKQSHHDQLYKMEQDLKAQAEVKRLLMLETLKLKSQITNANNFYQQQNSGK